MKKTNLFLAIALLLSFFTQGQTYYRSVAVPASPAPSEGQAVLRGASGWVSRGIELTDVNGLAAALAAKLDAGGTPYFSGQLRLGNNVTANILDGAGGSFAPQGLAASTTKAGLSVYTNDGTDNRRLGLFADQTNGFVGLSQTASTTSLPFVYRNMNGEWFRISGNGDVRFQKLSTAGYVKNAADGTLSSVTAIPQTDVTGLSATFATKQDALSGTGFLKFVGTTPSYSTTVAQSEVSSLSDSLLALAHLAGINVFTELNTFNKGISVNYSTADASTLIFGNVSNVGFTGRLLDVRLANTSKMYITYNGDLVTTNTISTPAYLMSNGSGALTFSSARLRLGYGSAWTSGLSLEKATRIAGSSGDPDASAMLDVVSTTSGALLPRMTTTQKNAIASPSEGLIVYDLTLHKYQYYNGGWVDYGATGTVDAILADGSTNPIQNNAVYDAITATNANVSANTASIAANTTALGDKVDKVNNTADLTALGTTPSAAASGHGAYYADSKFGKIIASFRSPDDNFRLQPHFSDGHISVAQASNSATWTWFGSANVLSVNNSGPSFSASVYGQQHRISYTTSATAGDIASMRNNGLYFYRGNAAGLGGWIWRQKAGIKLSVTGLRAYMGFRGSGSAPTGVDPSTLVNICGFGKDDDDVNWQFMVNDASGAATKVDLGASFPANTAETDWYTFTTYCPPNASIIYYHVKNETTGVETSGSVTTNLPVSTTFLAWQNWVSNGATAASAAMDFGTLYIETPY